MNCSPALISQEFQGNWANSREQKRHIRKNHINFLKTSWMAGCPWKTPAGVPAKMPFSVRFSILHNKKSLGHGPVDPCLSRRVSQGHPAGVPGIFLSLCALFFPEIQGNLQEILWNLVGFGIYKLSQWEFLGSMLQDVALVPFQGPFLQNYHNPMQATV